MSLENMTGSPPGLELGQAKQLSLANYSNSDVNMDDLYLWNEALIEGFTLLIIAALGIALNIGVLIMIGINSQLRKWMTGFAVHGCLLDIFKSSLCIPFGQTLLNGTSQSHCTILGTAYVVAQTAAMFNLLAMVLAEAYTFHVHNLNQKDPERGGAVMCVLFGVIMIYLGCVIIHLGPTLIGGHLSFNKDIGNCLFAYGEIHNFIVQAMWIGIITLTFLIIYRYIFKFYRLLKANEQFRITVLARYMAAMSRGGESSGESIFDVVYRLKRRVRVLFSMALINMLCWYPLFILTLADHRYNKPRYYYRILTVLAWSHSALMPLPLLLIDRAFGIWFQFRKALKALKSTSVRSPDQNRFLLANSSKESSLAPTPYSMKKKETVANCVDKNGTKVLTTAVHGNYNNSSNSPQSFKHKFCDDIPPPQTGGGIYDRLNAELTQVGTRIPSPLSPGDTVEARVNQSRETDLLYDCTSSPE